MMLQGDGLIDQIAAYRTLVEHPRALRALDNLEEVLTYLEDADLLSYISIDLGMLQSLDYYTGTIFRGFTYGMGYPLFSGGRYDNVVGAFGKQMPATGFSLVIDFALTALDRQQAETGRAHAYSVVAFAEGRRVEAVRLADELRRSGEVAEICYTCHEKTAAGKWAKVREASKLFFIDETGETTEIALPIAREEG
jgi:ATP phosphoribosyltransferase regulatory subunit